MNPRVACILLISQNFILANSESDEAESCPAPGPPGPPSPPAPPAPPAPAPPTPPPLGDVSTSLCANLPGSAEDWVRVLNNLKILLTQLKQVRQLIGTKHFLSELLGTLKVPGAKDQWMKLFEDISLEEIFNNLTLGDFISNDLLKLLKLPGDVKDWDRMLGRLRGQELADIVFDIVSLVKAPGTRAEWDNIVQPVMKIWSLV